MNPWSQRTYFAGLDWASDHHDVIVVDAAGQIVASLRIEHSAEGWRYFREQMAAYQPLPVAVETSHGLAVEQLLAAGCEVFPVQPVSAKSYRERKAPSGVKDDQLDSWSLADALRTDGYGWAMLHAEDPLVEQLRLLCRDEVALIEQRTALVNQLIAALRDYYPAALEAFEKMTEPYVWRFIESYPTPQALVAAGRRKWQKWLHAHKLWRTEIAEARMAVFARATEFCGSPAQCAAKSLLALSCARLLLTLERQLEDYRTRIESLYAQHPDHDIFGSLPGIGPKLGPRLLAELGDRRERFADAQSLQCLAGTAPVTRESGNFSLVRMRRGCIKSLRAAVHLWVDISRRKCAWAQAYYQSHRERGHNHACALRCLGQRWLKILWKMWQTRSPYDEALHTRNQVAHGSWNLQLNPS